jgi:hypothetical protein
VFFYLNFQLIRITDVDAWILSVELVDGEYLLFGNSRFKVDLEISPPLEQSCEFKEPVNINEEIYMSFQIAYERGSDSLKELSPISFSNGYSYNEQIELGRALSNQAL